MIARTRSLVALVAFISTSWLASAFGAGDFPDVFPEEWKTKTFREKDVRELADGVVYYHYHFDQFRDGPLSMYLVVVDWKKARVQLKLARCGDKLQTVPELTKGKNPLVAVNGQYFQFVPAEPYFRLRVDGVNYEPCKHGERYAGALAWSGADFPVITNASPGLFERYQNVIQGYHLAKKGVSDYKEPGSDHTPYTAIGTNPEEQRLVIFVNDGRHPDDSPGLSFNEVPGVLVKLGCTEVLSIDGGGSSTMVLGDMIVNRPSDNKKFDHEGARRVHESIYLTNR